METNQIIFNAKHMMDHWSYSKEHRHKVGAQIIHDPPNKAKLLLWQNQVNGVHKHIIQQNKKPHNRYKTEIISKTRSDSTDVNGLNFIH